VQERPGAGTGEVGVDADVYVNRPVWVQFRLPGTDTR
jgi:hypothetical protein